MLSLIVLIPLASVMVSALKLRPAEFWSLITKPTVRHAFATSIGCSFIAALINSVFGVIIAWVLVRYEFPENVSSMAVLSFRLHCRLR